MTHISLLLINSHKHINKKLCIDLKDNLRNAIVCQRFLLFFLNFMFGRFCFERLNNCSQFLECTGAILRLGVLSKCIACAQ